MTTPNVPLAPIWAGTMPLDTLNEALDRSKAYGVNDSRASDPQRFWSSPARSVESDVVEVVQLRLSSVRLLNTMTFELSRFPCDVSIEWYDHETNTFKPCLDASIAGSEPLISGVRESIPETLPPISAIGGHIHPQHSFSGHWNLVKFKFKPIHTDTLRLLLVRSAQGTPPVDIAGNEADYSLALKNIDMGYRVESKNDVPVTTADATGLYDTFSSTTNMFGQAVNYKLRVNAAENVLRKTASNQITQNLVWKCEPQPVAWSVVNFFADVRDNLGNPQVLDRFYIDPLYDGVGLNLYYSNSEPNNRFIAPVDPLPVGVAVTHDQSGIGGDVLHSGARGKDVIGYVDVDNVAVGWDSTRDWWFGGEFQFKQIYNQSQITQSYPLLDAGWIKVYIDNLGLNVATSRGDTLTLHMEPFYATTICKYAVSYDGNGILSAWVRTGNIDMAGARDLTTDPAPITSIRLNGFQGQAPGVANVDVNGFILKIDTHLDQQTIWDFFDDTHTYIESRRFFGDINPKTDNATLRYSPTFVAPNNAAGFIGGPADRFEYMDWTPVARDYTMRKGYMQFSPTKGKYWKFEMSGLIPQTYDALSNTSMSVNAYPFTYWFQQSGNNSSSSGGVSVVDVHEPGNTSSWATNMRLSNGQFNNGTNPVPGTGGTVYQPPVGTITSARVVVNQAVSQQLAAQGSQWRYDPSSSPQIMPNFPSTGRHYYETVMIKNVKKLAYFCGIKELKAYRVDYLATDDTAQYVENFYDLDHISQTNMLLTEDHYLNSGNANFAQAQSKIYSSNKVVSALQFSAIQSQPKQIAPDDDMQDPTRSSWEPIGDAQFVEETSRNAIFKDSLRIGRSLQRVTWQQIINSYPTWGSFVGTATAPKAYWGDLQNGVSSPSTSGGMRSKPITIPYGGTVYAAARIVSDTDLSGPASVQIIDDATGYVISQSDIRVPANKVTEWYTSYRIGSGKPFLWGDISSNVIRVPMRDTFARADNTQLGSMDSGNSWVTPQDSNGNSMSLQIKNGKAVTTKQGFYNTINAGSQWGSLAFHVGAMGTPTNYQNSLANNDYSLGSRNWTGFNANSTNVVTSPVYQGASASMQIVPKDATSNNGIISDYFPVIPGVSYYYDLSLYYSATSTSGTFYNGLYWYDSEFNLITSTSSATVDLTKNANTWQSVPSGRAFVAPANARYAQVIPQMSKYSATWYVGPQYFYSNYSAWLVQMGPLQIMPSGDLIGRNGRSILPPNSTSIFGPSGTSRAVQTNDDIRIDVLPTKYVPKGQEDLSYGGVPAPAGQYPYSLMVYLNNSFVRTISHYRGVGYTYGIKGNQGQEFLTWSWTPKGYGSVQNEPITGLPTNDNGTWVSGSSGDPSRQWQDNQGNIWTSLGQWDTVTPSEFMGRDDSGQTLIATVTGGGSTFTTSLPSWYGSMTVGLRRFSRSNRASWGFNNSTDINSWAAKAATLSTSTEQSTSTPSSLKITPTGTTGTSQVNSTVVPAPSGMYVTLRAKFFVTAALAGNDLNMGVFWGDGQGGTLSYTEYWFGNASDNTDIVTPNKWITVERTYIPPPGAANVRFYVQQRNNPNNSVYYLDDVTISASYPQKIVILDAENDLALDQAGRLLFQGQAQSTVEHADNLFIPGGLRDGSTIRVSFLNVQEVPELAGYMKSFPYPSKKLIMFAVNGVSMSGFSDSRILDKYAGKVRGVGGAAVEVPGAMTNPALMGTTFNSFSWSADGYNAALDQQNPTWGNVTSSGSVTYQDFIANRTPDFGSVRVQLVQSGLGTEVFDVDTLSLFIDPIMWEFSSDGGFNFYPAESIRNNPEGVLSFPLAVPVTQIGQKPGNALVWRVKTYAPGSFVSSLTIRPWYSGTLSGRTHRVGMATQGPNLMPYDEYGDLKNDARWKMWSLPIPQAWFFGYKNRQALEKGTYSINPENPLRLTEGLTIQEGG